MTKKLLSIVLTLSLCTALFGTLPVSAAKYTEGDYTYYVRDDVACISRVNRTISGNIVVPSTLGGYPVKSIGYNAFADCDALTGVTFSNGITSIEEGLFIDCDSLKTVTIPASITTIGDEAFACPSLTHINVANENAEYSSNHGVLYNKDRTVLICYPGGTTETTYTIPDGVISIRDDAFMLCNNLTTVIIPASVKSIGNGIFHHSKNLTNISVSHENTEYSSKNGVLFDKNQTTLIRFPEGKTETKYTIPSTVMSIDIRAFNFCYNLTSIEIPNSVIDIGAYAFYYCINLTTITIPSDIKHLHYFTFADCDNLSTIYYNGTEEDFQKINIDDSNYELNNAEKIFFHYVDFDGYSAKVSSIEKDDKVILALYKDKTLADMEWVNFNFENIEFTSIKDYDTAKILVWKDLKNCTPVQKAITLTEQ